VQSSSQIVTTKKTNTQFFHSPDAVPVAQPTVSRALMGTQVKKRLRASDIITPLTRVAFFTTAQKGMGLAADPCSSGDS